MDTTERLQLIYEIAASMVTRTPASWADYLTFASRIYKYPFDNALLIYAQDRSATMLATEEVWRRVDRSPLENARNILVCEYGKADAAANYLLDVSQAGGSIPPKQWQITESMQHPIALALAVYANLKKVQKGEGI